jgi:hypothetical protein
MNPDLQQPKHVTDIRRIVSSAALDAIIAMMDTVRFSKIVETVGKPSVHVLWIDPAKDTILQKAIKANRVMTIHQPPAGTKTDYGTIGFEKNVSGQVLIFPKSLRSFADKRVIGVKYDLLEWASVPKSQQAPKAQLAKPATKSKPKKIPAQRVEQPVAEESAPARVLKFPAQKVEPPEPEPTPPPPEPEPTPPPLDQPPEFEIPEPTPIPAPPPVTTPLPHRTPKNEERPNEEVEEIKKQVRQAMKILEEGKHVAAFNLLKHIVE